MMKEKLMQITAELNVEYVKIWEEICNIESPWSCTEGVDTVGEYFIKYANACGWQAVPPTAQTPFRKRRIDHRA